MKAIQTRRLPQTETKPTRIKAWAADNKPIILSRYCELLDFCYDDEQLHHTTANYFAGQLNWLGKLQTGYLPNGDYCHVFVEGK